MLKTFRGLILGLVVLVGSAYVTPTYASSASLLLTHIQPANSNSARNELVIIYNNSSTMVDITNWCLVNKSGLPFACFETDDPSYQRLFLPAYSHVVAVSSSMATTMTPNSYSLVYEPISANSGSIVASSDTVSLVDEVGNVVDQHGWLTNFPSNQILQRLVQTTTPLTYQDTDLMTDWFTVKPTQLPVSMLDEITIAEPGPGTEDPDLVPEDPGPVDPIPSNPLSPLAITELLPNATGSDTGNEFIEVFNPNDVAVLLDDYTLLVGPSLEKILDFPAGMTLAPGEYRAFTNAELSYTLLNTSSRVVLKRAGIIVSEVAYLNPKEGEAWALIEASWTYTNQPTPGLPNQISKQPPAEESTLSTTETDSPKPCADNQYRSPETNRCRLMTTATTTVTPCKEGQERNPETNRCRNIAMASSTPTPCKEGQERNPDTNRCRNIKEMSDANYEVLGDVTTTQSSTSRYVWLATGGVVAIALGYAAWEWRAELTKAWRWFVKKFARGRS